MSEESKVSVGPVREDGTRHMHIKQPDGTLLGLTVATKPSSGSELHAQVKRFYLAVKTTDPVSCTTSLLSPNPPMLLPAFLIDGVWRTLTTYTRFGRRLLRLSAGLLAGSMAVGQEVSAPEILVLSPLQVMARSLEMTAHYSTHQGRKMLKYIRVRNVARGSLADRAGLKKGDWIVAIEGWRVEGQELTALQNRKFRIKPKDGECALTYTVRRPHHDKEHEVTVPYRFPIKARSETGVANGSP